MCQLRWRTRDMRVELSLGAVVIFSCIVSIYSVRGWVMGDPEEMTREREGSDTGGRQRSPENGLKSAPFHAPKCR